MTQSRDPQGDHAQLYAQLFAHYDRAPIRVPDHPATHEILRLLYTPHKARLALKLPLVSRGRVSPGELLDGATEPASELLATLDEMIDQGLVLASGREDKPYRALWDFFFLMTDVIFARLEDTPLQAQLGRLREQLWQAGWSHQIFSSAYPFVRVLPYEAQIDGQQAVLDHERATHILEQADAIALTSNACHVAAQQSGSPALKACPPASAGYFCLNASAHYFVRYRGARYVALDEAKAMVAASSAAGLVLTAMNQRERVSNICLCSPDSCIHFRELRDAGNSAAIAVSGYTPQIVHSACNACGDCVAACPTSALLKIPQAGQNGGGAGQSLGLLQDKCVGCGLCAAACTPGAISMRRSCEMPVERTGADAWRAFEEQRRW